MNIKHWVIAGSLIVGVASKPITAMYAPRAFAVAASSSDKDGTVSDEVASFTVGDKTQVPGKTLKPGSYTIRIVDHLRDRMIVRIDRDGKQESTFLALPVSGLQKPAEQGPIKLTSGKGKSALRGFAFPNGTLAEFVYPKEEAVGIAKANNTKIPAVDPASEGRSADPTLSSEDMRMVTLWMLSPTTVGPDSTKSAIAAERYQAPQQSTVAPLPRQAASVHTTRQAPSGQTGPVQAPQQVASVQAPPRPRGRPIMNVLPHTAGSLPLVMLAGLFSLGFAGVLTLRRRSAAC